MSKYYVMDEDAVKKLCGAVRESHSVSEGISDDTVATNSTYSSKFIEEKLANIPTITVDNTLDDTSENPVQNKVVATALKNKLGLDGGSFNENVQITLPSTDGHAWIGIMDEGYATNLTADQVYVVNSITGEGSVIEASGITTPSLTVGGKNVVIDEELNATSENAIQNKAVKTYIDEKGYLYSPSGLKFKLQVADDGSLSAISVSQSNVFTFDTSKVNGSTTVTLQNYTGGIDNYDGITNWGDGTSDTSLTHTYSTDGIYTVETKYLINKKTTGDSNTRKMLTGCSAINSDISDYSYMFYNCSNLSELSANSWDTTKTTNMTSMFSGCSSLATLEISNWNTGNVSDMSAMFASCSSLSTLDINDWDVENVTSMSTMFTKCGLTELNVSRWKTKSLTTTNGMFKTCSSLVTVLNNFNMSKVDNIGYMFNGCTSLANLDVSNWDTHNVKTMDSVFNGCSALTTLAVDNWDVSNVTTMDSMFQKAGIKNLDLSGWDVSNVKNMMYMFTYGMFETININNWNAEVCSNIMYLFGACTKLHTLYAENVTFGKATNMMSFFYGDSSLTSLDLSTWNIPLLNGMQSTFMMCSGLTSLNLSGWDVTNLGGLGNTFAQCTALTNLNISGWDLATTSITTTGAFNKTTALTLDGIDMTDCSEATVTKITDAFNARTL